LTQLSWHKKTIPVFFYAIFLVAGCASQKSSFPELPFEKAWSGRLLLKTDSQPPSQFSALFELSGSPQSGRLSLSSPLGVTLASVTWQPGVAELRSAGERKNYASLDDLSEAMTGIPVPVAALFSWFDGEPLKADGWTSVNENGKTHQLIARRAHPLPVAEILLLLDPPSKPNQ
jgi:outer membrane lipoprotein LolB